jgi:transposase
MGGMKYIMSKETLGKLALIKGAVDGRYTVREIALRLNLSQRRIKQLKKRYKQEGENAFIHGNSGRHPSNYTDKKLRDKIISLKNKTDYKDTNFTHFKELLLELEGIEISYSTLSNILKSGGIESKRKHRKEGKCYRQRRRRGSFGEMLQADASSYDWFGNGSRCALHGFIDDATGLVTGLYFCQNECLMGYLEVLRQTLTDYGIPGELYADKAGIFFVNNKKEEHWTIDEMLASRPLDKTQFGLIASDTLGITMISAHTPQAKGRIERLWGTLQDRLPIWLKLKGITDMDKANRSLKHYIKDFNNRFSVEPENKESSFVPLLASNDLDKLLAVRHERTTDNCSCFSFQNFIFQIECKKPIVKKKITFIFSQKIGFLAQYGKEYYPVFCMGLKKNKSITHIPDVIKILIQKNYYVDVKHQVA